MTQGFIPNEYDSILEATTASAQKNILSKSKCESIKGKTFLDYKFNGASLSIHLDNEKYLLVSIGDKAIEWDVVSNEVDIQGQIKGEDVFFEFPNGDKELWNWERILNGFVGKKIAISPSDQFLFIYALGESEYMFDILIDSENLKNKFLFISES